jgi:hypothetical protein
MVAKTYSGNVQKYNMLIGILLCTFLTSFLFLIMPLGIIFPADVYLVVGGGIGLYITFKDRNESQPHIETGIVVGFVGSVLSLLLIVFFEWILFYIPAYGLDLILFLQFILIYFAYYGILYILLGILIGYLFGRHYRKKENIGKESPLF